MAIKGIYRSFPAESHFLPGKIFVLFAVIWGLILVFLNPPFQVPDEFNHFNRAYQVSELKFLPEVRNNILGGEIPVSIVKTEQLFRGIPTNRDSGMTSSLLVSSLNIPLKTGERSFQLFANTALYSPVPYIPQALGILLGRIMDAPPIVLFYLGRLFNLAAWIVVIYLGISLLPVKGWLFTVLALLPMSIFQAASVSADGLTNALSFLLISIHFHIAFNEQSRLGKREIILLILVSVLLTFSKNVYFLLVFLFFMIPVSKAETRKKYVVYGATLITISLVFFLTGIFLVNHIVNQIYPTELLYGNFPDVPKVNPAKQLDLILSDIPGFFTLLITSYCRFKEMIFQSFIGVLGWMELYLSRSYYLFASLFLLITALFEPGSSGKFSTSQRMILLICFTGIGLLFSVVMYLSWMEPGSDLLSNLQGRYFIPFAPLLLCAFPNIRLRFPGLLMPAGTVAFILISMVISLEAIITRYYL